MVDQRFSTSVHIMASLAFHRCQEGRLMTSDELAQGIRTNATVVRRLIARLTSAHLLKSYKGKTGGVELAREPKDISLKDIYLAAHDKTLLNAPEKSPKKNCPVSCSMGKLMKTVVDGVENNSLDYLAGIALSDLVCQIANEK